MDYHPSTWTRCWGAQRHVTSLAGPLSSGIFLLDSMTRQPGFWGIIGKPGSGNGPDVDSRRDHPGQVWCCSTPPIRLYVEGSSHRQLSSWHNPDRRTNTPSVFTYGSPYLAGD